MSAAVAQSIEDTRHEWVRDAIELVQNRFGVNHVELSLALGVWAPARGERGTSTVSRWSRGEMLPGAEQMVALMMLARGALEMKCIGRDGRRRVMAIVKPGAANDS